MGETNIVWYQSKMLKIFQIQMVLNKALLLNSLKSLLSRQQELLSLITYDSYNLSNDVSSRLQNLANDTCVPNYHSSFLTTVSKDKLYF